MSVNGARPVRAIVCDHVVLGFGPTAGLDIDITMLPLLMVAGVNPDHGLPWQLVGDTGDTAVMHLLLLGPDDDTVRPSLGRGPRSEPWPTDTTTIQEHAVADSSAGLNLDLNERKQSASLTIARARSARGLHAGQGVGSQVIVARGHAIGDPDDQYLFALTRELTTGIVAAYTHHVGSGHWTHHAAPSHRWVTAIYRNWPDSLLDSPDNAVGAEPTATHSLSATVFATRLKSSLSLVMSQAAHATTDDSMSVFVLPDDHRELTQSWLSGCDRRADEALANGVEPMLETYLTAMSHETTPAWAKLCHMIDRLQGLPHNDWPMVSGEDWSPYGAQRALRVAEWVHTMPRRSPAPPATKAVFRRMQAASYNGVSAPSRAQLGPGRLRQRSWGSPARTKRPG